MQRHFHSAPRRGACLLPALTAVSTLSDTAPSQAGFDPEVEEQNGSVRLTLRSMMYLIPALLLLGCVAVTMFIKDYYKVRILV